MYSLKPLLLPVLATTMIVVASNYLVQLPFNFWGMQDNLTWGAFTFPVSYLITDLTNRRYGAPMARRLVAIGFVLAVLASIYFATPRIALASGVAYLLGELLDIAVFNRLRQQAWWHAPLAASLIGSALDTALFFSIAFAGDADMSVPVPFSLAPSHMVALWQNLALWDFGVKCLVAFVALLPYGALLTAIRPVEKLPAQA